MTDKTIKEICAHLVAHDTQLKALSVEIRILRAENEDLKTAKAKQKSKNK